MPNESKCQDKFTYTIIGLKNGETNPSLKVGNFTLFLFLLEFLFPSILLPPHIFILMKCTHMLEIYTFLQPRKKN